MREARPRTTDITGTMDVLAGHGPSAHGPEQMTERRIIWDLRSIWGKHHLLLISWMKNGLHLLIMYCLPWVKMMHVLKQVAAQSQWN